MAYSVSALSAYTKDNLDELIFASMFDAKTASLIKSGGTIRTGIKSAENIQIIANGAGWQADSCGFTSSGTTTFTQRTITVGKVKINQSFCERDLETKWTQLKMKAGAKYEALTFEKEITALYVGNINQDVERAIWLGDTTSGNANLAQFDGLKKIINAGSGVVDANVLAYTGIATVAASTGVTASNALAIFQGIYKALPANVLGKDDVRIFCGYDVFRTYQLALVTANYFNYAGQVGNLDEIIIPGTNVKVIPVHGLNAANAIYALRLSNIYMGTDLENEEENFEIFFAKEADEMRFVARFKMGVQVGLLNEIVKFNMA